MLHELGEWVLYGRFCVNRKGSGLWVQLNGENNMAMCMLGCEKPLVRTGWAISLDLT